MHTLGTLHPFISLHKILVTPVLALLNKPEFIRLLSPSPQEVSCIFSHPLEAILDPAIAKHGPLTEIGSENWPYESEVYVRYFCYSCRNELLIIRGQNTSDSVVQMLGNTSYRMHRLRTSASPIKGLTADILVRMRLFPSFVIH